MDELIRRAAQSIAALCGCGRPEEHEASARLLVLRMERHEGATPDWLAAVTAQPRALDVLWGDPPPPEPKRKAVRGSSGVWPSGAVPLPGVARYRIAAALRSRPGRWAQVQFRGRYDSTYLQQWLKRMGGYEVMQRFEHGNTAVYARYVGR